MTWLTKLCLGMVGKLFVIKYVCGSWEQIEQSGLCFTRTSGWQWHSNVILYIFTSNTYSSESWAHHTERTLEEWMVRKTRRNKEEKTFGTYKLNEVIHGKVAKKWWNPVASSVPSSLHISTSVYPIISVHIRILALDHRNSRVYNVIPSHFNSQIILGLSMGGGGDVLFNGQNPKLGNWNSSSCIWNRFPLLLSLYCLTNRELPKIYIKSMSISQSSLPAASVWRQQGWSTAVVRNGQVSNCESF